MISIIDYGVANIGSLVNMHRKCGVPARVVSTPDDVLGSDKLILPGVGSFDNGVSNLAKRGLDEAIRAAVLERNTPVLGICLGMQILGKGSDEGRLEGLALVDAHCQRFSTPEGSGLKVPRQGWSRLSLQRPGALLSETGPRTRFYFSHSYYMTCADPSDVIATAWHGVDYVAMVERGHVYGVQFHPEKSHRYGMDLLRQYATA